MFVMKRTFACCLTVVLLLSLNGLAQEQEADSPTAENAASSETAQADAGSPPVEAEVEVEGAGKAAEIDGVTGEEKGTEEEKVTEEGKSTAEEKVTGEGKSTAEEEKAAEEEEPTAEPRATLSEPVEDKNYLLLGEYVGEVTLPSGEAQQLGVQVRPLGDDRFDARQYDGGLPGQEGFSGESQALLGFRAGDVLVLSGATWAVFVEHEQCRIIDGQGNLLGELPRVVRTSPTLGAAAPEGGLVLFDGSNTDQFSGGKITEDGWLMPGADVIPMFQDFDMHMEFKIPYMPSSEGQSRGNSGCYLLSRYELQILDSFSEAPTFNGCSSLYRQTPPDVNMSFPALQWQTYDIAFTAPRWASDGTKLRNARITVWHNGIKTHDNREIVDKTGAGKIEEPSLLPIRLQDHNDPVRFRNIWIIDRGLTPAVGFPVMPAE